MKTCAIIPARGGSKGPPKKNIKSLGGYPLIAFSIIAAKKSQFISRIIVSTDCEEIAHIAKKFGAEVPFLRPRKFATDSSTDRDFMIHCIKWFQNNEKKNLSDFWAHLGPITPIRDPKVIDHAIELLTRHGEATSLRSAFVASESPYNWFLKNEDSYFIPLAKSLDENFVNASRQMFPDVYIPDGYVDILKTQFMIETNSIHGSKILAFTSPFCIEVDTLQDFNYLEYFITKNGKHLFDELIDGFEPSPPHV
ncbi:MAG: acylneuraminate cytidylyltransferase family protein [Silvanigrellaceae bacterium]|nr:acylneuraminate cytidylyltransferase family protein [Silvanigrellaceae bacterium]